MKHENDLLKDVAARSFRPAHGAWFVANGDDAAVFRPPTGSNLVTSTDAMVEHVHFVFRSEWVSLIAARAMAAAVSDIAAMGATPMASLVTLGVPNRSAAADVRGLVDALYAESERWSAPIVGGDTVLAAEWLVSVTVFGFTAHPPVTRSGLQPGDVVWRLGPCGWSRLGLALVLAENEPSTKLEQRAWRAYWQPEPPVLAAAELGRQGMASAMIDVSDGLLLDMGRLASASNVTIAVDANAGPDKDLHELADQLSVDADSAFWTGGEDFALLIGARQQPHANAVAVATVTEAGGGQLILPDSLMQKLGQQPLGHGHGWTPNE